MKALLKRAIINSLRLPLPISLASNFNLPATVQSYQRNLADITKVFCNINFDDQSPVFQQLEGRDYGGKINEGISKKMELFLTKNPEVAITSFVVPNFEGNKNKNKFLLTNLENSEWVSYFTDLSKKYNLEYAIHGFFHLQKDNPFFQSHTEFAFKSHNDAMNCISKSKDVFNKIGWPITGFRQPGWDLSSTINLPQIAKAHNLKYLASSALDAGYNFGSIERLSNNYPTNIDGIINFPQNIELDWPIEKIFHEIRRLFEIKAFISIKAHFVDKDICNCLSDSNFLKLYEINKYIQNNFHNKIQFITMKDLSLILRAS